MELQCTQRSHFAAETALKASTWPAHRPEGCQVFFVGLLPFAIAILAQFLRCIKSGGRVVENGAPHLMSQPSATLTSWPPNHGAMLTDFGFETDSAMTLTSGESKGQGR